MNPVPDPFFSKPLIRQHWIGHLIFWLCFLGFPLIFSAKGPDNPSVLTMLAKPAFGLFLIVFGAIFYLNFHFFIPRFYVSRLRGRYALWFTACLLLVLWIQPFDQLVFQGTPPPGPAGMPAPNPPKGSFHLDVMSLLMLAIVWISSSALHFLKRLQYAEQQLQAAPPADQIEPPSAGLSVWVDYHQVFIPFEDIEYIEGADDYIKIHLQDSRTVLTRLSLKGVEAQLPVTQFARIHRSYIVAKSKISGKTTKKLLLHSGVSLPLSTRYPMA